MRPFLGNTFPRRGVFLFALSALLAAATSLLTAWGVATFRHSLQENGRWLPSKIFLEKSTMGAFSYYYRGQALENGELHLDPWFGHQEVFFRGRLSPRQLSFSMKLAGSDLAVLFERVDNTFAGIKFSTRKDGASFVFEADALKRFTRKVPLPSLAAKSGKRVDVLILFAGDTLYLAVDGVPIKACPGIDPQRIIRLGFKGGSAPCSIGTLHIKTLDGKSRVETFGIRAAMTRYTVGIAAILFPAQVLLLWWLYKRGSQRQTIHYVAFCLNFVLVVSATVFLVFIRYYVAQYPTNSHERIDSEKAWRVSREDYIISQLDAQILKVKGNVPRILFLGSSQTEGSGATKTENSMTVVLQAMLNARGFQCTCLGGGVSGADSAFMLKAWREHYKNYKPEIVVVNLSSNDARRNKLNYYSQNMLAIVSDILAQHCKILIVLEPNYPEDDTRELRLRHAVLLEIAAAKGLPVLDMQAYFEENKDVGLLWWDFVHLTDLGQRLFAERLGEELIRCYLGRPDAIAPGMVARGSLRR